MEIKLPCRKCERVSVASVNSLCLAWEAEYEAVEPQDGDRLVVEVACKVCGHRTSYDSPLFGYVFRLMFEEYLANKES